MYRNLRVVHRWIGVFACLFLVLVSATGFLLSLKRSVPAIQPPTLRGEALSENSTILPVATVLENVYALNLSKLKGVDDIDRVDYRPDRNVYKVLSSEDYHEVQVCGLTGKILGVAQRNDHLFEDLHDLRFFSDHLHTWVLPAVALSLFTLGLSGIVMFFVPVVRRWKFKHRPATP